MNQASRTLFDPIQIYDSHSSNEHRTTPIGYYVDSLLLYKSLRGILDNHFSVVSQDSVQTNFHSDDMYEKYLFELGNRIGSYLMYIFIEAMRPSSEYNIPSMKPDMKEELSMKLMTNSLDLKLIFDKFRSYILFNLSNHGHEFTTDTFDKVTNAFRNVYPVVYDALEQCWADSINMSIDIENPSYNEERVDHKHTWEEYGIYKLKNKRYFVCRGCGRLVNEMIKNRYRPRH
jgi:hypothetical protein